MPTVLKSGSLNLLEPSGPVQACNGIAFTVFSYSHYIKYMGVHPLSNQLKILGAPWPRERKNHTEDLRGAWSLRTPAYTRILQVCINTYYIHRPTYTQSNHYSVPLLFSLQSVASLRGWQKPKYCTIRNFCSQTFMGTKRGWRYMGGGYRPLTA